MPRSLLIGTRGQPDVIGGLRAGGPEFVAIDHKVIAFGPGCGFQNRQVATGIGLGIANGEDDFTGSNARQELGLLQLGAVGHQGRPHGADRHKWQRSTGNIGLFKEDELLRRAVTLAPVLLGPTHGQPAIASHLANGVAIEFAALFTAQLFTQLRGHQVLEIVPHLMAQGMLFGCEVDEHGNPLRLCQESGRW